MVTAYGPVGTAAPDSSSGHVRARGGRRRILVGVDGSPASALAVGWARTIAGWWSARVTLLHAAVPRSTRSSIDVCASAAVRAEETARATGQRVLEDAIALFDRPAADAELVFGAPDDVIVRRATELDVDLVVLGSSRKGPIASVLLGSTAVAVTRRARCSVLIVRDGPPPAADAPMLAGPPIAERGSAASGTHERRPRGARPTHGDDPDRGLRGTAHQRTSIGRRRMDVRNRVGVPDGAERAIDG